MNRKASVKLILIKGINDFYTGIQLLGKKITDFTDNKIEFDIPNEIFKGSNNCLPCEFILFNKSNQSKKYIIHVYICKNIFYVYLTKYGFTYEFIFLDTQDFKDLRNSDIGYEYDDNDNKHRIRISLINCNDNIIEFNGFRFSTPDIRHKDNNKNDSYQFSIYSKDKIICKSSELYELKLNFKEFYDEYNVTIRESYNSLIYHIQQGTDLDTLKSLAIKQKQIIYEFNELNFHISKLELDQSLNDQSYFNFCYYLLVHKFLTKNLDQINNTPDLNKAIDNFKKFKDVIESDPDLKIYQKIFGLIQYNYIFRKYNCINTYYLKIKNAKKGSVLNLCIDFLKGFISNLNEDSPIFFKLLEINSKFGYFENKPIYNFSLLNVEDIKEHVSELIPDVLYFYNCKSDTKAFSFSMTGEVAINEYYLFQKYQKMNLIEDFDVKDKENAENIAMTLARELIHEDFGHSKFRNKSCISNIGNKSPTKCVSKGKIKKLTYLGNNIKSEDLVKIFPKDKKEKGDSGHYLETGFGTYKGIFCIVYFDYILNVGKLIHYPDYFVLKEKIPILQKYLYRKLLFEKFKIILNEDEKAVSENLDLVAESYLLHRLLLSEGQNFKNENEHYIDKEITTNIISTKVDDDKNKENSSISKEEINNESSFTEEYALKDVNFFANNMGETKEKHKFLAKKRKLKYDKDESNNSRLSEINFEKEDNIQNDNDSNEDEEDEDDYGNLHFDIPFEYKVESDDDEACI